jgi:hypothetical protein
VGGGGTEAERGMKKPKKRRKVREVRLFIFPPLVEYLDGGVARLDSLISNENTLN